MRKTRFWFRNKRICAYFGLWLTLCLLVGCAARPAIQPTTTPESGVPGYYALGQLVEGGQQEAQAGLDKIEVQQRQEETILTLRFSGGDGLPAYAISGLEDPSRLCLSLSLSGSGFAGQAVESLGLFQGLFYETEGETTHLYLQFSGKIAYRLWEDGQELSILARADDMEEGENYYVRLPYGDTAPEGMTPALCEDGATLTYISQPYPTLEEAEAARQAMEEALQGGDASMPQLSLMKNGAAPEYLEPISMQALETLGALRKPDGGEAPAELLAVDARFLCWLPGEDAAVMARPTEGEQRIEEVWLYGRDGNKERLFEGEFSSLQKAAVSPDGRYLALIEQPGASRTVYVYDREQGSLELLSVQGFGDYSSDIAWSAENKLYAMTGEDVMQLMAYDPALSGSEQSAVNAVEEREGSYGTLGCSGGWVYFSDENGDILRVDPATATRELFTPGDSFLLSGDGQHMAVSLFVEDELGVVTSYLSVKTIQGEEVAQVEIQAQLWNMCWDADGSKLYYLLSSSDPDYPTTLYVFDLATGQSRELGSLAGRTIFSGAEPGQLVLLAYLEQDGALRPVCYQLSPE